LLYDSDHLTLKAPPSSQSPTIIIIRIDSLRISIPFGRQSTANKCTAPQQRFHFPLCTIIVVLLGKLAGLLHALIVTAQLRTPQSLQLPPQKLESARQQPRPQVPPLQVQVIVWLLRSSFSSAQRQLSSSDSVESPRSPPRRLRQTLQLLQTQQTY
jgi:hypothetical protein